MKRWQPWAGVYCGLLAVAPAWAGEPGGPPLGIELGHPVRAAFQPPAAQDKQPPAKPPDTTPKEQPAPPLPDQQAAEAPQQQPDAFAQAPSLGAESPASTFNYMMGDFQGLFLCRRVLVPTFRTVATVRTVTQTTTQETFTTDPRTQEPIRTISTVVTTTQVPGVTVEPAHVAVTQCVPLVTRGAFKIAENESPRPVDRVFLTYNFYSDARIPAPGGGLPRVDTQLAVVGGDPTLVTTLIPGGVVGPIDVHREVIGFERTFLDGSASVGLRAPVLQTSGDGGFGGNDFGDLSVVLKYRFFEDETGDLLSGGLVVTAPTGPDVLTVAGPLHPWLLQPWVGGIWNWGDFYAMGFSSVVVPTASDDVTLLFNDVSFGYVVYRGADDAFLKRVVPTFEIHVTTPLDNRGELAPVTAPDLVVLTQGVQLGLGSGGALALGLAVPITGPRPFDVEAMVQFNWLF